MDTKNLSRRKFIKIAGVAAASAAVASVSGVFDRFSQGSVVSAAPNAATLQQNLSAFADLRFGMFNHFNLGTFTDEEWAAPSQSPSKFAPTAVNCTQWANAAVAAKMKFGILTCKHHDGFALWPTAYSSQCVTNAGSTAGRQDIVRLYTDAFRAAGLKVGIYYSIWDRTMDVQAYTAQWWGSVPGTKYIDQADINFCKNQITELLTNYGTIDIFVTDGYGWEMGQQAIPYQEIRELVKSLQPNTIMLDHGGLSQPWLGDAIYFEEPLGVTSPTGNTYASCQGQTISNGWFWHPATPTTDPMSKTSIVSHLTGLEPKYTTFILNCPPNRNGVLDTNIVNRLAEVGTGWSPNLSRASLPTQQFRTEHPVTPRSASATTFRTGESASNAIDALSNKDVETLWSTSGAGALPQSITLDLGGVYNNISTLEYLPKQWGRNNSTDGDITSYTIFVSTDGSTFTQVASGTWAVNAKTKLAEWPNTSAAYVKLQVNAGSGNFANVNALQIGGRSAIPTKTSSTALFDGAGYFMAINRTNNMALDGGGSVASGSNLKQWTWDGNNNLQWQITDLGTGYYKIINRTNGLAIDTNGSTTAGSTLVQKTYTGATTQQWQLINIGMGYYRIVSRASGFGMDSGGSVPSGSVVKQWTWDGNTNLMWRLEKVATTASGPTPTPGPTATPTSTPVPGVVEAETYNSMSGIATETCGEGGLDVANIENGDWIAFNNFNFSSNPTGFQARVASATSGGNIEIRLDSATGTLVGTCAVTGTGGWQTYTTKTCSISGASGTHTLYLKFTGGTGFLFNVNWFQFTGSGGPTPTPSGPTSTPTRTPTPNGSFPVPGTYYRIINRNSGKCLDVVGSGTGDGVNVDQWTSNGGQNQQWSFVAQAGGYYEIIARNSGKALEVAGSSTTDGGNVQQWTWGGGNNQQWTLVNLGTGYYEIVNRNSGKVLDVVGSGTGDGVNVDQWTWNNGNNQQWQIMP